MAYKYFLYSSQQAAFQTGIEKSMGKTYRVGVVFAKGTKKSFTELSSKPSNRFSDTRIVAEGEETDFRYEMPRGV